MALQLPSEIVVDRVLPTVRALLAAELDARGFTQQEIGDRLGVTQAAVSNYIGTEAPGEARFREHPRTRRTVDRIAEGFATGDLDEYGALVELLGLVRAFEDRGPICAVHEEVMPELQGLGCDLCVRGPDPDRSEERAVLGSVRRAVRQLVDTPGVIEFVPNVGTNVAMAVPNPTDELDIAAIPGRLHSLRGRIHVPSEPEFGASRHVARTVLAATAVDPSVRGALNLATDDALVAAAREAGHDPIEFAAAYEDRGDRLESAFRGARAVPQVVYHEGAFGIEPITYVLGTTAEAAVSLAVELIEAVRPGS